jgi:hypothetical protein
VAYPGSEGPKCAAVSLVNCDFHVKRFSKCEYNVFIDINCLKCV